MRLEDIDFKDLHRRLSEYSNENDEISYFSLQTTIMQTRMVGISTDIVNENSFAIRAMIDLGLIEKVAETLYKVIK